MTNIIKKYENKVGQVSVSLDNDVYTIEYTNNFEGTQRTETEEIYTEKMRKFANVNGCTVESMAEFCACEDWFESFKISLESSEKDFEREQEMAQELEVEEKLKQEISKNYVPVVPVSVYAYGNEKKIRQRFHEMASEILKLSFSYDENSDACESYVTYQMFEGESGLVYREISHSDFWSGCHESMLEISYVEIPPKEDFHNLEEFMNSFGDLKITVRRFDVFDCSIDKAIKNNEYQVIQYELTNKQAQEFMNGKDMDKIIHEIDQKNSLTVAKQ